MAEYLRPDEPLLARILESGLRAPSAENRHYLRFRLRPDGVDLLSTDTSTWRAQPHRRMLALLAYGAVLENMCLSSAASGLELETTILPDPRAPDLMASLRWKPARDASVADPLERAIAGRHTNRRFYRRTQLDAAVLADLAIAAARVPGAGLEWLDGRDSRRLALEAIRVAETERFVGERLHRELFGAVRFEHGWRNTSVEWLAPSTLEIEPPMRLPFALLRHPRLMRILARLGGHHLLGLRAGYLPAASAPHLGMIVAGGEDDAAAFAAGRAFQRVWLCASANGLALQPMAATTALVRQIPGDGWVRPRVQARLRALLAALSRGHPGTAFMLFRIGRAGAASAIAGRREWRDYLLVD